MLKYAVLVKVHLYTLFPVSYILQTQWKDLNLEEKYWKLTLKDDQIIYWYLHEDMVELFKNIQPDNHDPDSFIFTKELSLSHSIISSAYTHFRNNYNSDKVRCFAAKYLHENLSVIDRCTTVNIANSFYRQNINPKLFSKDTIQKQLEAWTKQITSEVMNADEADMDS